MFDLTGRHALITGASGGLGLHFASTLAAAGATVTLASRRMDTLEDACRALRDEGHAAQALKLDVTDADNVREAIGWLDTAPDILINNAGVTRTTSAVEMTEEAWDFVMNTNLKGAFLVSRQVAERLIREQRGGGAIVHISSILGHRVAKGVAAYATSKAGLIQLAKAQALEWARYRIRVNALCPGYIATDINRAFFETEAGAEMVRRIPQRRLGEADDLVAPLLLMCADEGRYMTGTSLTVDGGHLVTSL